MSQNEISAKAWEIKELCSVYRARIMDEAAAEIEALKDAIKAHMDAENVEELTADVFRSVNWGSDTPPSSPTASTLPPLRAACCKAPELYAKYTKETICCRITLAVQ